MFIEKIIERTQQIPACDLKDEYVGNVMIKFCLIAISEKLPLLIRIDHVETILNVLELFKTFENDVSQKKLDQVYNGLFQDGKKNKISLDMAIAINTIRNFLKKGRENDNAQKFYAAIEAAADFLNERKENLAMELNQNKQINLSPQAGPPSFFSGNQATDNPSTNPSIRPKAT